MMMETEKIENPYVGLEYVTFLGKFAAYRDENRSHDRRVIGVFDTLEQAQAAKRTSDAIEKARADRNRTYEKAIA